MITSFIQRSYHWQGHASVKVLLYQETLFFFFFFFFFFFLSGGGGGGGGRGLNVHIDITLCSNFMPLS